MRVGTLIARLTGALAIIALAGAPALAVATPITHLVVIFQENVSFDHYFGTYPNATNPSGEPGFTPKPNTPTVNGLTGTLLTNNPNLNAFGKFKPALISSRMMKAPTNLANIFRRLMPTAWS